MRNCVALCLCVCVCVGAFFCFLFFSHSYTTAISRLKRAICEFWAEGVDTNRQQILSVLSHPFFVSGHTTTTFMTELKQEHQPKHQQEQQQNKNEQQQHQPQSLIDFLRETSTTNKTSAVQTNPKVPLPKGVSVRVCSARCGSFLLL